MKQVARFALLTACMELESHPSCDNPPMPRPEDDTARGGALWRVRPRAWVFAAAALVALDIALRVFGVPALPRDFRLPDRTLMGLDGFVAQMERSPRPRVACVGDSVMHGGGTSDPAGAIPAHLGAYNLGMTGAHANDMLPLVALIARRKAADAIVIDFDYRFYRGESVTDRYPDLYEKAAAEDALDGVDPTLASGHERALTALERFDRGVASVWRLYAVRDHLTAWAFGERPKRALNLLVRDLRARAIGARVYNKRAPSALPYAELRKAFDMSPLAGDNIDLRYLAATVRVATRAGIPVVVFAGPLDRAALDRERVVDWTRYEKDLAFARRLVESEGGVFVDLTDAVPAGMLMDTHHPMSEGNRVVAEELADVLAPLLPAGERP